MCCIQAIVVTSPSPEGCGYGEKCLYVGHSVCLFVTSKVKVLLYSLPCVGPGSDLGVQAVSQQVTLSHPPGGRLSLLSARPAVTCPAEGGHRPSASTKVYCLVTEGHGCEQLTQGCYSPARRLGSTSRPLSHQSDVLATRLSSHLSSHSRRPISQ